MIRSVTSMTFEESFFPSWSRCVGRHTFLTRLISGFPSPIARAYAMVDEKGHGPGLATTGWGVGGCDSNLGWTMKFCMWHVANHFFGESCWRKQGLHSPWVPQQCSCKRTRNRQRHWFASCMIARHLNPRTSTSAVRTIATTLWLAKRQRQRFSQWLLSSDWTVCNLYSIL